MSPDVFVPTAETFVASLSIYRTEANALEENVNAKEVTATEQAAIATAQAVIAAAHAENAASAANFKGLWTAQTGAANVPYCVYHLNRYWALMSNLADVTAKTPGTDSEWQVVNTVTPNYVAKTADYTVLTTDLLGGTVLTNSGATGEVIMSLPAGAAGYEFEFEVVAAQYLRIKADGTETISFDGSTTAAGGYIRTNVPTRRCRGKWNGTKYVITEIVGYWRTDS
jgi:hypothetical protein